MELTGERVIRVSRERLYQALHDPVVLRQAIPGCQAVSKLSPSRYDVTVVLKVGPLRGTFFGPVEVYNVDMPAGYSLRGEAAGGMVGSARGNAHVALASIDDGTTNLAYYLTGDLDGQLGGLESAVVNGAARSYAAEFFSRLEAVLELAPVAAGAASVTDATGAPMAALPAPTERAFEPEPERGFETVPEGRAPAVTTALPVTDATGAPLVPDPRAADVDPVDLAEVNYAAPVGAAPEDDLAALAPARARRSFGQASRDAPEAAEGRSAGGGLARWFFVLVGAAAIVWLLSGGGQG